MVAVAAVVGVVGVSVAQPLGEGWLLGAPDDGARFELLQDDAGGFGRAMFEVSVRYERMYEAIVDGNFELALHHWDTIGASIEDGIVRRPGREANARVFVLDGLWDEVAAALESGDRTAAEGAFMQARGACLGCHVAEGREYLNDQGMFNDLVFGQ